MRNTKASGLIEERFRLIHETPRIGGTEEPMYVWKERDAVSFSREEIFTIWKQSPDNSESRLICEKFLRLLI